MLSRIAAILSSTACLTSSPWQGSSRAYRETDWSSATGDQRGSGSPNRASVVAFHSVNADLLQIFRKTDNFRGAVEGTPIAQAKIEVIGTFDRNFEFS